MLESAAIVLMVVCAASSIVLGPTHGKINQDQVQKQNCCRTFHFLSWIRSKEMVESSNWRSLTSISIPSTTIIAIVYRRRSTENMWTFEVDAFAIPLSVISICIRPSLPFRWKPKVIHLLITIRYSPAWYQNLIYPPAIHRSMFSWTRNRESECLWGGILRWIQQDSIQERFHLIVPEYSWIPMALRLILFITDSLWLSRCLSSRR